MNAIIIALIGLFRASVPLLVWLLNRKMGDGNSGRSQIPYWNGRPRSIGRRFFGRESDMKAMSNAFESRANLVLSGGPGTGKSQLATEFVERSKRKGFWTPGGQTALQSLISLAPHLGVEREERSDEELLIQIRRGMQELPDKTLWVIDNLPDLDQLNELLNETGRISLLVTTQDRRQNVVPGGVDFQTVEVLDLESAVQLLCRSGRHDSKQTVFSEIVEEVGLLPRAVEVLAVQLDSPTESPERLLAELRKTANPLELDRF